MKGTTRKQLLRLLRLTTAIILLAAMLAACGKDKDTEPSGTAGTSEPTETIAPEPTDAPTEAPTEPDVTEPEETTVMATVDTELLNVRTGPSSSASIAGQLTRGAQVEVLEQTTVEDILWGRTEVGWIRLDYVILSNNQDTTPDDTTEPTTPEDTTGTASTSGSQGTITAGSLHIRKGAGTSYESVGKYSKGDKVTILETKDNWGRTDKGWISLKHVDLDGTSNNQQPEETDKDDKTASTLVTDGKTTVLGHVVINTPALYVRYGPGTSYDVVDRVYEDERVAYYQEKNGWVRIKEGWISLAYTEKDGASDDKDDKDDSKSDQTMVSDGKTTALGHVVINSGALNVRYGPGTKYDLADKCYAGDRVAYYQKDGNWVRTEKGWISLSYAYVEGQTGEKSGSGTVTGDLVNVRTGPGTSYSSVKKLNKGDKVKILEQITVGKTTWGYTGDGWISMDYVKLS